MPRPTRPRAGRPRPGLLRALALAAALAAPSAAAAQGEIRHQVFVNSEIESYLRVLQVAGISPLHPWSVRQFGPREVDALLPADSAHPWARRYDLARREGAAGGVRLIAPSARLVGNSAIPYGYNDGPVWAGKGLTASVEAGVAARFGPLSVTLAPLLTVAQNADFDVRDNGLAGNQAFANWRSPRRIDLPDRFGDGALGRLDPGQSTVRLDVGPAAVGVSTANQHWGPATDHPLLLGSNAPGFLHAFAGTSRPVNVGVGRLHGRMSWGTLRQSPYATTAPDSARRFATGLALVFTPRFAPGLEVGGGRFFHVAWGEGPSGGDFLKPFEGLLKETVDGEDEDGNSPDNQLASLFFRFTAPGGGFEAWGEYGKEDHNRDFRQFFLIPDNGRAYLLGFRRVWTTGGGRTLTALRGELMNAQRPSIHRGTPQAPWYIHGAQRQGHTERGQALGSAAAFGGAAGVLAVDRYTPRGRLSLSWTRLMRGERPATGENRPRENVDVIHSLGAEGVFFLRGLDLSAGLRVMKDYNRDFDGDVFNLNAFLGVRLAR